MIKTWVLHALLASTMHYCTCKCWTRYHSTAATCCIWAETVNERIKSASTKQQVCQPLSSLKHSKPKDYFGNSISAKMSRRNCQCNLTHLKMAECEFSHFTKEHEWSQPSFTFHIFEFSVNSVFFFFFFSLSTHLNMWIERNLFANKTKWKWTN